MHSQSASSLSGWSFRVNAEIRRSIPPLADAGRVAAMFGLADGQTETLYDGFAFRIAPGEIVAVAGPSGSGKSVLLREVAAAAEGARWLRAEALARSDLPAVGVLRGGSLADRLGLLARCGLAEAAALVTPARHLCGGQLVRLALAEALHSAMRAGRPELVIADEFGSCLDLPTARILCRQVRKLVSASRLALLVATPRSELIPDLRPDRVILKRLHLPAEVLPGPRRPPREDVRRWPVQPGTIHDYDRLSEFHYLAGRPACHKRVYVVRRPGRAGRWREAGAEDLAAVLVMSPPLAGVRGRNLATGGRYACGDRAASLALLNAEVECISRVIVHPVYRGCGLAVRLVCHALATAETPFVEALAAMGRIHPLFERAGMKAIHVPPPEHIIRLLKAAQAVGLSPGDVAAVGPVKRLLRRRTSRKAALLRRALDRCIARTFSAERLRRVADPVAEACRRTARRYVYYFARAGR